MITNEDLNAIAIEFAGQIRLASLSKKNVLTLSEAAMYIGVTDEEMTTFVNAHKLPFYKVATRVYFKRSELEKWITSVPSDTHLNGYTSSEDVNYNYVEE